MPTMSEHAAVTLDPEAGTLVWPGGIDLGRTRCTGGEGSFASCHVNARPEDAYRKAKCVIIVCTAASA